MSTNTSGQARREFRRGPVEVLTICPDHRDWTRLQSMLTHTSWLLHYAPRLSTALAILRRRVVPVLLCAAEMPDGDWKEVLRLVQSIPDAPAVIVFTEQADEALWRDILEAGAQDIVTKPFDASDLYEVISLAFRAWSIQPPRSLSLARS